MEEYITSYPQRAWEWIKRAYTKGRFIVTVEPVLMVFMIGSFLQYTATQQLLYLKTCMIEYNNTDLCDNLQDHKTEEEKIQGLTSHWLIIINAGLTFSSLFSILILGAWSDRVGRRVTMILPCLGSLVNAIILIFCAIDVFMPVWYIVLGTVLMGITGGFSLFISSVFSYMGDCTTRENRTMRFAILEAMTFAGSFVGLFSVGFVIDNAGYISVFCYYVACNVLPILYILLWLPESLPSKAEPPASSNHNLDSDTRELVDDVDGRVESELGQVGIRKSHFCAELFRLENLKSALRTLCRKRPHYQRLQLILLVGCLGVFQLVGSGEGDTTVLYLKKDPLGFSATYISYYLGLKNLLVSLTLLTVMPLVRTKTSIRDTTIACVGIIGRSAAYVLLAFSRNVVMVFMVPILMASAGVPTAVVRSMLSKLVAPSEQGSLFSFTAALESLMVFVSSFIFNVLYPETINILEGGFVFIVMALLLCCPFIVMFWIRDLQNGETAYLLQAQEALKKQNYGTAGDYVSRAQESRSDFDSCL